MPNWIQKLTDKIYLRGVPNILYRLRNFTKKHDGIYTDPKGIRIKLNLDNYFQNNIRYGYYEYEVRTLVENSLKAGDIFLDIGANIGYMTLLAANKVGDKGRVFSFEPNPDVLPYLQENVRFNKLRNTTIENSAVSKSNGVATLYCGIEHALSTMQADTGLLQIKNTVTTKTISIDDYLEKNNVPVDRISLVKIDTEGHEYSVLDGMRGLIQNGKASFIIENNYLALKSAGVNLEIILNEFFFNNKYLVYWLESKNNNYIFSLKKVRKTIIDSSSISDYNFRNGDFYVVPHG